MSKAVLFFLACLLVCRSLPATCQYYFYNSHYYDALLTADIGLSAGGMNCLTDLGGKHETGKGFIRDLDWRSTHPCSSMFAAINYNNAISIRIAWTSGQVSGCDSMLKRYASIDNGRYQRNLSFRSDIKEISLTAELYLRSLFSGADAPLLPYLIAGIGSFSFHPQTSLRNSWINLEQLHTEGQGFEEYADRKTYASRQLNIPLGGGVKYELSPLLNLRFELLYRHLFTDYLDDVSTSYINPALFDRNLPPHFAALAKELADRRRGAGSGYHVQEGGIRGNGKKKDAFLSVDIRCSFVLGRRKV